MGSQYILGEKEQSSSLLFVILNKKALYILGEQARRRKKLGLIAPLGLNFKSFYFRPGQDGMNKQKISHATVLLR